MALSGWPSSPSSPPTPPDPVEAVRWQHTRNRRLLLEGPWERLLDQRVRQHVGHVKRESWGPLDWSRNPFRLVCRELSTLYQDPYTIRHDLDGASDVTERLAAAGLFSAMPRHMALTVGCRQYLSRLTATQDAALRVRPVPPDMVLATSPVSRPDVPDRIAELRWLEDRWAWEVLDISDPEHPTYRVVLAGRSGGLDGEDVSDAILGGSASGDDYPYRRKDGTPVLPYIVHHAERRADRLFDAFEGSELYEGSLNLAVLMSFWFHTVKDASWPQRLVIGARPAGLETVGADGQIVRQEVVTDPASLLVLEAMPTPEGTLTTPQWGQFEPGGDPESLLRTVQSYAASLAQDAGVSASDIQRVEGPQSGYAIALTESGKRQAQKRFAPHFRWADERLVGLAATLLNRATGSDLPEDGYTVTYASIPLTPEELRAQREHVLSLMGAGLKSPVDAMLDLHPGLTRAQATAELERIRMEREAATGGGPASSDAATLAGAQTAALVAVVSAVARGELPRAGAAAILRRSYGLSDEEAAAMLEGTDELLAGRVTTPAPTAA